MSNFHRGNIWWTMFGRIAKWNLANSFLHTRQLFVGPGQLWSVCFSCSHFHHHHHLQSVPEKDCAVNIITLFNKDSDKSIYNYLIFLYLVKRHCSAIYWLIPFQMTAKLESNKKWSTFPNNSLHEPKIFFVKTDENSMRLRNVLRIFVDVLRSRPPSHHCLQSSQSCSSACPLYCSIWSLVRKSLRTELMNRTEWLLFVTLPYLLPIDKYSWGVSGD